jgi:iron complex outermembrane receptor protein
MNKQLRLHLIAAAALSLAGPALAQVKQIDRVEITGSMIKRTDSETPAPVTVIKREDIERSGATSLDELMRMESSTSTGSLNDMDTGSGFAAGTASISLRGMGSAATLVLINGRRLAPAGVVDPNSGQSTVFNVNAIPVSAIERIEILKDGASSLYGSDAMAGVVNIIMRSDYQGRLVELNTQQRFDGLFKNHRANGMIGFGDLAADGYNVFIGVDLYKRDGVGLAEAPDLVRQELFGPLYGRLAADSTSAYPGNIYTYNNGLAGSFRGMLPGCETTGPVSSTNATQRCLWASDPYVQYTSDQSRAAAFLRASWAPAPGSIVSAELIASRVESEYLDSPTSRTESRTQWGDGAGNPVVFNGLALPANHPDNPTRLASASNPVVFRSGTSTFTYTRPTVLGLRYRFADLPYNQETQADNVRLVLAGSTTLGAWELDGGFLHHIQKNSKTLTGRISLSGLNQVLADGSYRFGGSNSPQVLALLAPDITDAGEARTTSLDLRGSRELGRLAGGAMMLGLGGELRHESFEVSADSRTAAGDVIGRGIGQASGSRNVQAAYAELQLPFVKGLETQAALRAERYSDFGNAVTGKLGAKYKLLPNLALRGTFATGFRAPSLSQIANSSVFAFGTVQDKKLCPVSSTSNDECSRSVSSVARANPDLDAEKSKSYTLGLLFDPLPGMDLVLDAWYIERRGEVDRLSAQEVVNREDEFPGAVVRLDSGTPGTPGQIVQVIRQFKNLAESSVGGLDYEFGYRFDIGAYGKLRSSFKGTRMLTRKRQTEAGRPHVQTLGYYGVPRTKNRASLNWSQGAWSSTLTLNYQGRFRSYSTSGSCAAELTEAGRTDLCTMKAWKTADLAVSYKGFKGMRLSATLRNLAGSRPPFDPTEDSTGVDTSYANPFGRYLSLTASYEF